MNKQKLMTILVVITLLACSLGCGKKSGLEGKVVDSHGKPVVGLKIMAIQEQPIKGYNQLESVTSADGSFRINGLYPQSKYVLTPLSDKWNTPIRFPIESGPQGETVLLPSPLTIEVAFSKKNGSPVVDLTTGATRFTVASKGAIVDSKTGLEWMVKTDGGVDYDHAQQWIAGLNRDGGNWRMPNPNELQQLYQPGSENNLDPVFKFSNPNSNVWGGPIDSSSAWIFVFYIGQVQRYPRYSPSAKQFPLVFAVRTRP